MEVYLPWGIFSGALGAAYLFIEALPLTFASRRFGLTASLGERLWVVGLGCLAALAAWPIWAAGHLDWPGRNPSFLSIVLMVAGAGFLGFVVARVVGKVVAARLEGDDDALPSRILRPINTAVVLALIVLTASAWWTLWPNAQVCLSSGYC
ncbi:hypothetical protein [Brevundimonas vesicularis]|uniref:hypothetical protein n=1 Tax=Brevundimonas vesicularis TaxID=41276 RepID=UPI0022AC18EE|nr:hypothetical protein [Brevundimonas vesicularis]